MKYHLCNWLLEANNNIVIYHSYNTFVDRVISWLIPEGIQSIEDGKREREREYEIFTR